MKLLPDRVGAEPKKIAILACIVVVLGVVYYINRTPGGGPPSAPRTGSSPVPPVPRSIAAIPSTAAALTPVPTQRALARRGESSIQDFKPSLKLPEGIDVSRIDPSLHLDLIAKLQAAPLVGGERSLFDFGAPPRPKTPPPPVNPIKPTTPPAITPAVSGPPSAPAKPPVPPIPLKFYGYVNGAVGGSRQAFFLQGDDIFVAGENDTIQNRFKVIRIGVNSAVIEDTTNKNQQTIPLVQELAG